MLSDMNGDEPRGVWDQTIGPFYDTARVMDLLGLTADQVAKLAHDGALIRLFTADPDAVAIYPTRQFSDGAVVPGLREVLVALRAGGLDDEWTHARWLLDSSPEVPVSAIDELRAGNLDSVLEEAHQDAAVWRT